METCPTCGALCAVISDSEGTAHYEPLSIEATAKEFAPILVQLQNAEKLLGLYREHGSPDLTRMVEYEAKIAGRSDG